MKKCQIIVFIELYKDERCKVAAAAEAVAVVVVIVVVTLLLSLSVWFLKVSNKFQPYN